MKKILIATAAVAMITTSCSNNEIFEETQNVRNAISFDVTTNKQTKALATGDGQFVTSATFPTGGTFDVNAYYTGTTVWASYDNKVAPNFMSNVKVTQGTPYTYDGDTKYWPNNSTDQISFFAYYPSGALTSTVTNSTAISGTFTVAAAPASQVDLMYASALNKTKPAGGNVEFDFKHALTQVVFSAEATVATGTTITIDKITLSGVQKVGTLTFIADGTSAALSASGDANGSYELSFTENNTITSATASRTLTSGTVNAGNVLLMVPQTLSEAKVKVEYTTNGVASEVTLDLGADVWDANTIVRYKLAISMEAVTFSAKVTDWDSEEKDGTFE